MKPSSRVDALPPTLLLSKRGVLFLSSVLFFLFLRLAIEPPAFKDYAQYVDYLSNIKSDGIWAGGLDLASNLIFYFAGTLFSDREEALAALYIYLFLVFVIGAAYIVLIKQVNWLNYWAFLVLFGPLLAFITIRATPAYFAFFIAFFLWRDGRAWVACFFALLAATFHFSALLVLPVFFGSLVFYRSLEASLFLRRAAWFLYFMALLPGFDMTIFGPGPLVSGFEIGELFVRYSAYIEAVEPVSGIFHRIYFWGAAGIATAYLIWTGDDWRCKSLVMFASIQFYLAAWSPVLAFRQSIFWVAPALLLLPMYRVIRSRDIRVLGAASMIVILCYSFYGILETAFLESF